MSIVQIIGSNGGTSSTSSAVSLTTENLTSQINGLKVNFNISSAFVGDTVQVYINGVLQIQNEDYTEDSDKLGLTFALAPESTDKLVAIYTAQ